MYSLRLLDIGMKPFEFSRYNWDVNNKMKFCISGILSMNTRVIEIKFFLHMAHLRNLQKGFHRNQELNPELILNQELNS